MAEQHDDALARLKADFDQSIEATRDFAKQVAGFRFSLLESGVPEKEVPGLTAAYITAILGGLAGRGSGESDG